MAFVLSFPSGRLIVLFFQCKSREGSRDVDGSSLPVSVLGNPVCLSFKDRAFSMLFLLPLPPSFFPLLPSVFGSFKCGKKITCCY